MTITEFLDWLDGNGLIVTDDELLEEFLNGHGMSLENDIHVDKETH